MRDILFRGKRTDDGEWVEGYLFKIWDKSYILWGTTNGVPNMTEVIPETVGQYTGLTDKNGTKIYEGDIVNILDYQSGIVTKECGAFGIVIKPFIDWDYLDSEIETITGCRNRPYFCRNDNFISLWELMWNYNQEENSCYVVEVIGNIHDNPDLIKGEVQE